jgi:hypothetical protein
MLENRSQKIIMMIAVLAIFALACTTAGGGETAPTPDALGTVLAGVTNATQNAAATQAAMPESTDTSDQDEDAAPTATKTEDAATPESAITETPTITNTPSGFPSAIPLPDPQASNFYTCLTNCQSDGSNHQTSFPEKIEIIYFQFAFTEFPVGAPYSRAWYKDGAEWVRYDCYWPGPEEGIENITLTDPLGLPSGTWNLVVTINGEQVLNESLTIQGSWSQWSPPGHFTSCYGKR